MNKLVSVKAFCVGSLLLVPYNLTLLQEAPKPKTSDSVSQCNAIETPELTITCAYRAALPVDSDARTSPHIVLTRAVISFIPSDESHMRVELTLTNKSTRQITDQRAVYLTIDNEKGENIMRRRLPHVDFAKLEPGKRMSFLDTLLAPAFPPGFYTASIWIPSVDPLLKFDPKHNFLFNSIGVPNPSTGLNHIGEFAVPSSSKKKATAGRIVAGLNLGFYSPYRFGTILISLQMLLSTSN